MSRSFLNQIFPLGQRSSETKTFFSKDAGIMKKELIVAMVATIADQHLLPASITSDRGLVNVFNRQQANPEQPHDMLSLRKIGYEFTEVYSKHQIIGISSASSTMIRRKKLLTISSNAEKEREALQKIEKVIELLSVYNIV